jgi:hypothetical protein
MSLPGQLRRALFGIPAEIGGDYKSSQTSEGEARRIAESWAVEYKKYWTMPASATLQIEGDRRFWIIQSNAHGKGHRIVVTIDDATGQVADQHVLPR